MATKRTQVKSSKAGTVQADHAPASVASQPAAGQRVGYVRVSSADQNPARQLDGIELHRVFKDFCTGSTTDRPGLAAVLAYLREGDCLVVHSMDRLARNLDDLRRIVRELTGRGVSVEFVKEGQTFTADGASPMANLMLSLLGAFAEFERALIRERQREGIAIARQDPSKYKGRAPALSPERAAELRAKDAAQGGRGRAALAREFGVSRQTLYQYLGTDNGTQDDGKSVQ